MWEIPGLTPSKGLDIVRVIGLTGGVGAGKSLVLGILSREFGAETIETDEVARRLMEPGEKGYTAVVEALGNSFLKPDGSIDRQLLAARIFTDEKDRKTVDSMIHPMVWKTVKDKISASQAELIVIEFAIMDKEAKDCCHEIWYVRASEENRVRRLAENRGYTKERSESMMASQASEEMFLSLCDRVIENDGSIEGVRGQLEKLLGKREDVLG